MSAGGAGVVCVVCVVCGAASWRPLARRAAASYVECAACGLARLDPFPGAPATQGGGAPDCLVDQDPVDAAVDAADGAAAERAHRANARHRLTLLREAGALRGTVIDVGCENGVFLDEARTRGWRPVGVEASPEARDRTVRRTGAPVFPSLAAVSVDHLGPVDVVTFAALEDTRSPEHAVADAWTILRPGGLLMLEVWDHTSLAARLLGDYWPPLGPPPALYLFSRATLPRLLVNTGFDRASVHRTVRRVSAHHVAQALIRRHPGLAAPLTRLVLRTRLAGLAVTYGLGDLISVAARKPLGRR